MKSEKPFLRQALFLLILPIIVTVIILVTSLVAIRLVIESEDSVVYDHAQDLIHVEKLRSAFEWKVASNRGFYLTKDTLFLDRESQARKEFRETLDLLKSEIASPIGIKLLRNIDATEEEHQRSVDLFKDYRKADNISVALKVFEREVFPKREKLRLAILELTELKIKNFEIAKRDAKKAADQARLLVIIVALTSLLLAGYLGWIVARKLANAFANEAHSRQIAEASAHARSEFIAVASHEFRTPLTSLQMQLQIFEKQLQMESTIEGYRAQAGQRIRTALKQCNRLTALVETLLDVVLLSEEEIRLEISEVDLVVLLHQKTHEMKDECAQAGCEITLTAPEQLKVRIDVLRFGQAIMSLLTNAIKYGQGKPVEVSLVRTSQDIRISVRDYGVGISKNAQGMIFEKFSRAISSKSISGFGVGLFLAREIIEAHQGTLTVESDMDKGSTFIISIPLTSQA